MPSRWSLITVWSLYALLLVLRTTDTVKSALTWDVFGYYLYLPATFIHDDPGLKDHAWLDEVMATYDPSSTLYQLVDGADGSRVVKYSSGMAVVYAPSFFIAHLLAGPLGYPADGFSPPYQYAVVYGTLALIMVGLFLFRRVLLHFFDDRLSALLIAAVVLGTNYLHLAALDGTLLTHPILFTLYAGLVLATIRWHARPSFAMALCMGGAAGLITLVRPSEGVALLIPLLWLPQGGFAAKWKLLRANASHIALAALAFAIAVLPQPLYWHAVTGQWLFYSYVNPGEGFDFTTPHTWNYLFSFRKGWFVYTPLMALAIAGMAVLWKKAWHVFWAIGIFLIIDVYIVSSWTNWWYAGGSFSARSMVPTYVLLAIPLGYLLRASRGSTALRWGLSVAIAGLVLLNLFQTWQWRQGIIGKERMTAKYYAAIFGRTSIPEGASRLMLVDRPIAAEEHLTDTTGYRRRTLYTNTFDDRPDSVYTLGADDPYTPGPDVRFAELTDKDHVWLRTTARLWVGDSILPPPVIVTTFHHDGQTYKYSAAMWSIPEGTRNAWIEVSVDYITPEVRSTADNVKTYIWEQHGNAHRVDDLRVEVFEPE